MSNDPLKDLFQEAFDKEHVPFDPAAWDQMNQLLNQNMRRRFLWIGLGGSGGFALLTLFIMFFLNGNTAIYQPRGAAFTAMESVSSEASSTPTPSNAMNKASEPSETKSKTSPIKPVTPASPVDEFVASGSIVTANSSSNETSHDLDQRIAGTNIDKGSTDDPAPVDLEQTSTPPVQTADTTSRTTAELPPLWNIPPDVFASLSSRRGINPINRIVWEGTPNPAGTFESRTLEGPKELRAPSQFYLRVGASRNFMLKTGQVGGIGYERQLAEHFMFSAEINLTRDHTYFNYVQEQTVHGFDQYNTALRIWASEMIHIELPVLLRFRWNRITVGSGLTLGRLWSAEVIEESVASTALSTPRKQPIGAQTEVGYVNWSALQALQLSLPIDLQYQLDERYGIGVRYQHGLKDAFTITQMTDRLNRLEFYVKINLNP